MANTSSAKKANRAASRKRVFNARRARAMRSSVKEFSRMGKGGASKLPAVFQAIDKAAKRGVIKKNAAARMKSRLSKMIAAK